MKKAYFIVILFLGLTLFISGCNITSKAILEEGKSCEELNVNVGWKENGDTWCLDEKHVGKMFYYNDENNVCRGKGTDPYITCEENEFCNQITESEATCVGVEI